MSRFSLRALPIRRKILLLSSAAVLVAAGILIPVAVHSLRNAPASGGESFRGEAFDNCSQVILVTAASMDTSEARLSTFEKDGETWTKLLDTDAAVGKYGLVYDADRIEGSMTTPVGVYPLPYAFGTAENPGTGMPYEPIGNNTFYDGQYGSPTYNQLVEGRPDNQEYEYMSIDAYQYGLDILFNPEQKVGKGNAIFLHCSTASGYTAGCVSVSPETMVEILKWLDPGREPRIVICPESDLSQYFS